MKKKRKIFESLRFNVFSFVYNVFLKFATPLESGEPNFKSENDWLNWCESALETLIKKIFKNENQGFRWTCFIRPWFSLYNYNTFINKVCFYLLSINKLIIYRTSSTCFITNNYLYID